jgi:hypothetical protein
MRSGKWTVAEQGLVAAKVGALAAAKVKRITGPMVADAVPARSLAAINAFLRQHYGGQYGLPKRDHKRKRMAGTEKESATVGQRALVVQLPPIDARAAPHISYGYVSALV